uniref:N-acetylglucosaminylphosphatidylinositol deacetylase n=1 Tax=Dracunculus medinensis TaxID=318479 RepID=A0A0N4U5Q3_DRAME
LLLFLKIFSVCGALTGISFAWGIQTSLRLIRAKNIEDIDARLNNGVALARRALFLATVISVSGFGLFILGISASLEVDTPRQFGDKMKNAFGDRFKLKKTTVEKRYPSTNFVKEHPTHSSAILLKDRRHCQRSLPSTRRALFIIAHPDDESMFFAPTIIGLRQSGSSVYLLCITVGDHDGLGQKRKIELSHAVNILGISVNNLMIMNYESFRDGFVSWNREKLADIILRHIQILDVDTVVTFDGRGVSSHPNHIACFRAVQLLYSNGSIPADAQVFVLESVPVWRKYIIALDAAISSFHSTFLYVSSFSAYICTWRAMLAHSSQMVWFRYLYLIFSRYILINTLRRIHLQQRYYVYKKKL